MPKPRMLTLNGKTQSISAWARELGLSRNGVYYRLAQGWPDDVITGQRLRVLAGRNERGPKAKRMQPWEREAAVQAYIAGEKLAAIAAEFGCCEENISQLARRRGIPPRVMMTRSSMKLKAESIADPEMPEDGRELFAQAELAQRLGTAIIAELVKSNKIKRVPTEDGAVKYEAEVDVAIELKVAA